MATAEQLVNAGGEVAVAPGLSFLVRELSMAAEVGLLNRLRLLAKRALGPAGFYANSQAMLDWMKAAGMHAERAACLATVADLQARGAGVSGDLVDDFRQSPAGVAEELFWRTRQTHPEATLDEFKAVVNDVNALEVHLAILDAVAPKKAETPSSSPPGS